MWLLQGRNRDSSSSILASTLYAFRYPVRRKLLCLEKMGTQSFLNCDRLSPKKHQQSTPVRIGLSISSPSHQKSCGIWLPASNGFGKGSLRGGVSVELRAEECACPFMEYAFRVEVTSHQHSNRRSRQFANEREIKQPRITLATEIHGEIAGIHRESPPDNDRSFGRRSA